VLVYNLVASGYLFHMGVAAVAGCGLSRGFDDRACLCIARPDSTTGPPLRGSIASATQETEGGRLKYSNMTALTRSSDRQLTGVS
jgi:hypothetical protein